MNTLPLTKSHVLVDGTPPAPYSILNFPHDLAKALFVSYLRSCKLLGKLCLKLCNNQYKSKEWKFRPNFSKESINVTIGLNLKRDITMTNWSPILAILKSKNRKHLQNIWLMFTGSIKIRLWSIKNTHSQAAVTCYSHMTSMLFFGIAIP